VAHHVGDNATPLLPPPHHHSCVNRVWKRRRPHFCLPTPSSLGMDRERRTQMGVVVCAPCYAQALRKVGVCGQRGHKYGRGHACHEWEPRSGQPPSLVPKQRGRPPSLWPLPPMICTRQGVRNPPPPLRTLPPFMRKQGPLVYAPTGHGSGGLHGIPPSPICEEGAGMGRHVGDVMPPYCTLFLAPPTHPHSRMECGGSGAPFPWGTCFVHAPSLQTESPLNEGWGPHTSPLLFSHPPSLPACKSGGCDWEGRAQLWGTEWEHCTQLGGGTCPPFAPPAAPQAVHKPGAHGGLRRRPFPFPHVPPLLGAAPTPRVLPFPPRRGLVHPWCMDGRGARERGRGPSMCPPHPCTRIRQGHAQAERGARAG
jgi:hypothetical protein